MIDSCETITLEAGPILDRKTVTLGHLAAIGHLTASVQRQATSLITRLMNQPDDVTEAEIRAEVERARVRIHDIEIRLDEICGEGHLLDACPDDADLHCSECEVPVCRSHSRRGMCMPCERRVAYEGAGDEAVAERKDER